MSPDELTPQEIAELVTGAQKYLAPEPDPRDNERLTDREIPPPLDYASESQ